MTASWRSRQELEQQAVTLAAQGVSRRAIARALGVSRNTLRRLLEGHRAAREHGHSAVEPPRTAAPRARKIDEWTTQVANLLARHRTITAQRIFEELRSAGFGGGYTAVKKHVRSVRPRPRATPSLATPSYDPGEMAESDWSPYTLDLGGRRQVVQAHGYVLVHSRRKFFSLHEHADLHALMAGHAAAFERFGGLAQCCKYDSQKPVVLRWEGQQPIYNPRYLAFAAHYEMRPVAVRRGHPNDKPRVERSFWELERSFFNGRSFRDFDDLAAQLTRWLDEVCDLRPRHGSTPLERFAIEQPNLLPLPLHPYDTARVVYRVANLEGYVPYEGNEYAVPYDHVTDLLPVRITERQLFVYAADLRCIARHELAPRSSHLKLDPERLHPPLGRKGVPDLAQLAATFEQMGESSAAFFQALSVAQPRFCGFHARQILLLRERYDTADLEGALGHALRFGALEHKPVARILAARAAPRTLDEYVADETARHLEAELGHSGTEPRDLAEYDRLPVASPARTAPTPTPTETSCPSPSHRVPPTSSTDSDGTSSSSG